MAWLPIIIALALMGAGFYFLAFNTIQDLTVGIMLVFLGAGLMMMAR